MRRSDCPTGKVAYQSKAAASFFAVTDGLRPYICPLCRRWHLTSDRVRHPRPVR